MLSRAQAVVFALVVLFLATIAVPGRAEEPCANYPLLEESLLGSLPTEYMTTLAIEGDRAYLGGYSLEITVLDLSDPTQPALLGEIPVGVSRTDRLWVEPLGETAYLGGAYGEIPILDVSDPARGEEIGSIPVLFGVTATALAGDRLFATSVGRRTYAGTDTTALYIFDISDPRAPVQLAEVFDPDHRVRGLELRGDLLVTSEPSQIRTLDVGDPGAVTVLDTLDLYSAPDDMAFDGDLLYLAGATGELHVVDATEPSDLALLGTTDLMAERAFGLSVRNETVVISCESGGLRMVDVSDPVHPSAPAAWMSDRGCYGIALLPDQLVIAGSSLLMTCDFDPATGVKVEAIIPSESAVRRQVLDGDVLYVLDGDLRILDIGNPSSPVPLGTFANGEHYSRMSLDGTVLYLGSLGGSVVAVDVADPTNPTLLSWITNDQVYSLHAADGRLALGPRAGFVQLYDVSDPAAPVLLGTHDAPEPYRCYGVALEGNHLYMTTGRNYVLDISDPANPHTVAELPTGYGLDLVADGKWIYTPSEEGVSVLRFTEPDLLEEFASLPLPNDVQDLHLDRMLLSAACQAGGVRMYDVSDPSAPILVAGMPAFDDARCVAASPYRVLIGNYRHSLSLNGGIEVFPAPCDPYVSGVPGAASVARGLELDATPNPFNPRVRFHFEAPRPGRARLTVFDLRGRRVAVLLDRTLSAGPHRFEWDGRDAAGRSSASGAYIARLEFDEESISQRVTLLR